MNQSFEIGAIYCVRWNSSGDMLASCCSDGEAKVLDFKTGKELYKGKTQDYCELFIFNFTLLIAIRLCDFNLLHLREG